MEICSSSGTSGLDFALDFLDGLHGNYRHLLIHQLQMQLRVLQAFDLYLRKCRRRRRNHEACSEQDEEDGEEDVISFRIQDLVIRGMQDLEFALNEHRIIKSYASWSMIETEVSIFREAIELFFETDIKASFNSLLDLYWWGDPGLVIDFIDSVLKIQEMYLEAQGITNGGTLLKKLTFLKSFIRFAMLCGVEDQQLIDLLIHAQVVVPLISVYSTEQYNCLPDFDRLDPEVFRLIHWKIIPNDPEVGEIYVHVMMTASKLSRSGDILALEKNKHLIADFIDFLLLNIMELKQMNTRLPVVIMNQMQKVQQGLTFLTIVLRHQKQPNKLCYEMENLIGAVVCDAAIIIFSLFGYQLNEEGLAKETDLAIFQLLEVLKFIRAEVSNVCLLRSGFPRTNELGSMDFLLKNLVELARYDEINGLIAFPVDQIHVLQKDLEFLRSFLEKIKKQRDHNERFKSFWSRAIEDAYKVELVIDYTLAGDGGEYCFDAVARNINLLKIEAQEILDSISTDDGQTKRPVKTLTCMPPQVPTTASFNNDQVGLDNELETITHILTSGLKQLDVVQIVGMPGLGKTTFADRLYKSDPIIFCFHIRAWCIVSQDYSKHNLLGQILCSIDSGGPDEYQKINENDLADLLYKRLKGKKYLIVLDDVWDIEVWNFLNNSLPDDANGSRILITSRLQSLQFKRGTEVHHLRHLTEKESWELMQRKLFGKKGYPPALDEIGYRIAKFCGGLPLTIVLVAGILANSAPNCWEEVEESLSINKLLDDEYCMKPLEMSYNHLPDDLKSCFLYFAAFKEDENIDVRRLLWLWISEGFVQKAVEGKSLEDVAEDYLNAMIGRSLVMVSEQRTLGGAKACRLHDLIHEFSVEKAKEENFLHNLFGLNDLVTIAGPINPHRVCDRNARNLKISGLTPFFLDSRTSLLFERDGLEFLLPKLLRVLDLRKVVFYAFFPEEVVFLVHLRYLSLNLEEIDTIPSAIANLSRLQTFLVRGGYLDTYLLPETIWDIKTLRHLHATGGFIFPVESLEVSSCLDHLDSLSLDINYSSAQHLQEILTKFPSIGRLKCRNLTSRSSTGVLMFNCLSQLESLRLKDFEGYEIKFPLNLKKLTLSGSNQPWSEISRIGKLPSLEVLKLHRNSFVGEEWEMKEGEFPNLRFLGLSELDIRSWTATSDNFLS